MEELWTAATVKWLKDSYNMTPEDIAILAHKRLNEFLHTLAMNECNGDDTTYAENAAEVINVFLWKQHQWSDGMVKWLQEHYQITPEQIGELNEDDLYRFWDLIIDDEYAARDTPEEDIVKDIENLVLRKQYKWAVPMIRWLWQNYQKTPEQIETLDGAELDEFFESVLYDECN